MLITISGPSGSGKSSAAKGLAERIGYDTIDVGQLWREMAKKHGMDLLTFGRYAQEHPEIDIKLDAAMLRRAEKGGKLILQSRLAGVMTKAVGIPAVRFWIDAAPAVRAARTAGREGISPQKALKDLKKRDLANRQRYLATYGLDVNDRSVYDAVVRTDNLTIEEVVSCLETHLSHVWPMRRKTPKPRSKAPKPRPPLPSRPRKRPLRKRK